MELRHSRRRDGAARNIGRKWRYRWQRRGAFNRVVSQALNLAALCKLPVVFICENNLFAMEPVWAFDVARRKFVARRLRFPERS